MGAVIQDHLYQVIGTYKVREKEASTKLSIQSISNELVELQKNRSTLKT